MASKKFVVGFLAVALLLPLASQPASAGGLKDWLFGLVGGYFVNRQLTKESRKAAQAQAAALKAAEAANKEKTRENKARADVAELALEKAREGDFKPASELFADASRVASPQQAAAPTQSPVAQPPVPQSEMPVFVLAGWKEGMPDWAEAKPSEALGFASLLAAWTALPQEVQVRTTKGISLNWFAPTPNEGEADKDYLTRSLDDYQKSMRVATEGLEPGDQLVVTAFFPDGAFKRVPFILGGEQAAPRTVAPQGATGPIWIETGEEEFVQPTHRIFPDNQTVTVVASAPLSRPVWTTRAPSSKVSEGPKISAEVRSSQRNSTDY